MKKGNISFSVIRRLPRYYRFLGDLLANGIDKISSKDLSGRMNLTASQIRQDLNCFGGFGQQGYGYNINMLHHEIGNIIGVNKPKKVILIGAGHLGSAIATHMGFEKRGFKLIGIFDNDHRKTGSVVAGVPINHSDKLAEFCKREKPEVAILCIPKAAAQEIADELFDLGIKGFWNFSHYDLRVGRGDAVVENVHLGDSLLTLRYQLNNSDNQL